MTDATMHTHLTRALAAHEMTIILITLDETGMVCQVTHPSPAYLARAARSLLSQAEGLLRDEVEELTAEDEDLLDQVQAALFELPEDDADAG